MKKVVIIGAGLGGMTAGAYLAKEGYEVIIIDKNKRTGGRIQEWKEKGFRFDLGPSFYWMPEVIEEFFNDFNFKTEDFYRLKRLDPSYRIFFEDETVDLPASKEGMAKLFDKYETGAGKKLLEMLRKTESVYKIAMKKFVPKTYKSWWGLIEWEQITGGFEVINQYPGFLPVDWFLKSYFKNRKLIKILSFPIFFLGESVKRIPSVYCLMNHVDINLGTWHPMGGFQKVAKGFEEVARKQGVNFLLDEEVEKIVVESGKAKGVKTKKGKLIEADIVISNGDYFQTDQELLDKKYSSYSKKYWSKRRLAPSALLVHLGLRQKLKGLMHHSLFFHQDWDGHNKALFEEKKWPKSPLYYTSCVTKTDKTAALKGKEVLTVLIPLASGLKDKSKEQLEDYAKAILKDMENKTQQKIIDLIETKKIYSIDDFKHDYNAYMGNAYGLGQTADQTAIFRPSYKSKKVSNLYYCGQFTTPGIGVPMVVISGRSTALRICQENNGRK